MIKAMITLIIIQLYVTNTVCNESNESELLEEIQCPGNICGEKCCTEPGYICCNNNLFCAREIKYCVDYEAQPTMFVMSNGITSFINHKTIQTCCVILLLDYFISHTMV